MRGWITVVMLGVSMTSCKDKELEAKLAATEAKLVATEASVTSCEAKRAGLESKVAEQDRALAAAKAETATVRSTLPPIVAKPSAPTTGATGAVPAGKRGPPVPLGF